jgi:hypothetical protein
MDLRKLNDYLDEAGVHDFSSTVPTLGLSLEGVLQERFRLGWEGRMFLAYQQGRWADAHFSGALTSVYFGYDAVVTSNWRVRPEVGIGGSVIALRLDGLTGRFHDIAIPADDDQLDFRKSAVLGRAGVTAEWTPAIYRSGNGLLGMGFAISAGVYAPLTDESWEIVASGPGADQDVRGDGPRARMLAGYASLGVRFGGGITETN